jgi:carbon monoxide dehydrogenase subunit G
VAQRGSWWLTSSDHVITDDVPAPPEDVRAFYCDLTNIARVHPLVVSIESTGRTGTDDSYTQTYRVRDRIPFGPVAMKVAYTASVHVPTRGDVLTEARQFPHVRLYGTVSFDEIDGGTRVTERIRIEAPRLLAALTVREAVQAHAEMLAGIGRCFQ